MADHEPTTPTTPANPWGRRALPLSRELERAERLLQRHPDNPILSAVRGHLVAALRSHGRGELSSAHAESIGALAALALDAAKVDRLSNEFFTWGSNGRKSDAGLHEPILRARDDEGGR